MTCAHVVNVALNKVAGVESVDVSLNKALATVKLKPGNKAQLAQMLKLIHEKGYTVRAATISVRGVPAKEQDRFVLKVSGSGETLSLATDPGVPAGQTVVVQGTMMPAKDLRTPIPVVIRQVR